jgi:glutamate/tyrosine decarboxylase-like PLP-dependent enzyme
VICVQAGELNTGAFDPFPEIIDWARQRGAWVHLRWGVRAVGAGRSRPVAPDRRPGRRGLLGDRCDKWLNVRYDCGIALVRRPADLCGSFASAAGYLPGGNGLEAMHHTPHQIELSRETRPVRGRPLTHDVT